MNTLGALMPRSIFGAVLAAIYIVIAVIVVLEDQKPTTGGWINLNGMVSYLVTFPISFVGEQIGRRPDYRRFSDMALAIGGCAMLVYMVGAGFGKLCKVLFSATQPG